MNDAKGYIFSSKTAWLSSKWELKKFIDAYMGATGLNEAELKQIKIFKAEYHDAQKTMAKVEYSNTYG